jgi:hypothetical protein
MRHPFTGATLVIRRDVFVSLNGYKWGGYAEDYELSIRLQRFLGSATFLENNYYIYRIHSGAMSGSQVRKIFGVLQVQLHALLSGSGTRYLAGIFLSTFRLLIAFIYKKTGGHV